MRPRTVRSRSPPRGVGAAGGGVSGHEPDDRPDPDSPGARWLPGTGIARDLPRRPAHLAEPGDAHSGPHGIRLRARAARDVRLAVPIHLREPAVEAAPGSRLRDVPDAGHLRA